MMIPTNVNRIGRLYKNKRVMS